MVVRYAAHDHRLGILKLDQSGDKLIRGDGLLDVSQLYFKTQVPFDRQPVRPYRHPVLFLPESKHRRSDCKIQCTEECKHCKILHL